MRPAASPRSAGTAAWPSDWVDAPATFSRAWARFEGAREDTSAAVTRVMPLAGGPSRPGALPAVTVTDSSICHSTATTSGCTSAESNRTGRA